MRINHNLSLYSFSSVSKPIYHLWQNDCLPWIQRSPCPSFGSQAPKLQASHQSPWHSILWLPQVPHQDLLPFSNWEGHWQSSRQHLSRSQPACRQVFSWHLLWGRLCPWRGGKLLQQQGELRVRPFFELPNVFFFSLSGNRKDLRTYRLQQL